MLVHFFHGQKVMGKCFPQSTACGYGLYIYMSFIKQVKYYKTKKCELPMNDKPVNIRLEKKQQESGIL